jgi:benzoyl-CoA reductase/2-hydroxyglutaryl-CoA dehydratase subunit BcrC/BadD/HgdB
MEELKNRLAVYSEKLENDPDYEMSDEMQEEYYAIQEELEMNPNPTLQKEFNRLCKEFENPDGIIDATLNDMYPDGDDDY